MGAAVLRMPAPPEPTNQRAEEARKAMNFHTYAHHQPTLKAKVNHNTLHLHKRSNPYADADGTTNSSRCSRLLGNVPSPDISNITVPYADLKTPINKGGKSMGKIQTYSTSVYRAASHWVCLQKAQEDCLHGS